MGTIAEKRRNWRLVLVVLVAGVVPEVAGIGTELVWGHQPWPQEPLHQLVEGAGAAVALGVAILLLLRLRHDSRASHLLWYIAALVAMGMLDGIHAVMNFGIGWSWLRHGATLMGGVISALVWVPVSPGLLRGRNWVIAAVALAALLLISAILWLPNWLPYPWVSKNDYSTSVRMANAVGGVGYLSAACFFLRRYLRQEQDEDLVLASQLLLFSSAGLLFGFSHLWGLDWWVWHLARLLAYGVVLIAAYQMIVRLYSQRQQAEVALEQANSQLEQRVLERTLELGRSEARLAQAVRAGRLGIFEHDHRSGALQYSALMRELMYFDPVEPVTMEAFLGRVLPEDRKALAQSIARAHDPLGDGLFSVEYRVGPVGKAVRWLTVRSQTFFEGEGRQRHPVRTIGAVLDITEQKELQSHLEHLVEVRTAKLQELVAELEHFSYTITHDMRAPLRAMQGYAEVLADSWRRRIKTAAARMDLLITDALNYSRAVRQDLALAEVDADTLLRGMLDSYPEFQPSRAQIRLEGDIPPVLANEAGLTQCLSNLLGNAVKFVKPGQTPQIRVYAERRENWVRIWVEDQGIGIAPEMLPRIFDMFSRGHRDYEGTGIGLALVRKVMERMGGRVGVESEPGRGSRFWMELQPAPK